MQTINLDEEPVKPEKTAEQLRNENKLAEMKSDWVEWALKYLRTELADELV